VISAYATHLLDRTTFPAKGAPIDCAVSGGPDSLALLVLAVTAGCEVTAYHVDHGLRPGSEDEAGVVADAAAAVGAAFVSLRVHCPAGPNLEARARKARLAVLPAGVATGHTADDQAETILLNLLRGAGLDGLAGMRPGPQHPILAIRRFETEELVDSLHLTVVRDPMNDDLKFRRNLVRHELLPLMTEIAGRDVVALLCRQAALLADDADFLTSLSSTIDPTSVPELAGAPVAVARRALRGWLRTMLPDGQPPDAAALERILQVAAGRHVAAEVAGGTRVRRSKGHLYADSPLPPRPR
jgi:tRNA(Ile)-lysidine synthase